MNKTPLYVLAANILIGAIVFFIGMCRKQDTPKQGTPTPAETALQRHQEREPVARAAYAADTVKSDAAILALHRKVDSLTARLSTQAPKAQQSASTYAKTPTLDNCHQALTDCQEESETQRYALAVQDRMLAAADSAKRKDRKEIARSYGVSDSLAAGWDEANKALRKAQKVRPWSIGVQGGAGLTGKGVAPYIGIGVQYSIIRF